MKKGVSILTAGLIACAVMSVPYGLQVKKKSALEKELVQLRLRSEELSDFLESAKNRTSASKIQSRTAANVVEELMSFSMEDFDPEVFIRLIHKAGMSGDISTMLRLLLPFTELDAEGLLAVATKIQESGNSGEAKEMALQMMAMLQASQVSGVGAEQIEQLMVSGSNSSNYSRLFIKWMEEDPVAAQAWLEAKLEDGSLDQKGTHDDPVGNMNTALIAGLLKSDVSAAIQKYGELSSNEQAHRMGQIIWGAESIDYKSLMTFAKAIEDGERRNEALKMSAQKLGSTEGVDEVLKKMQGESFSESEMHSVVSSLANAITDQGEGNLLDEKLEWLEENSPEKSKEAYVEGLIENSYYQQKDKLDSWVEKQSSGELKDLALKQLAASTVSYDSRQFEKAARYALDIEDLSLREDALKNIYQRVGKLSEIDTVLTEAGLNPGDFKE